MAEYDSKDRKQTCSYSSSILLLDDKPLQMQTNYDGIGTFFYLLIVPVPLQYNHYIVRVTSREIECKRDTPLESRVYSLLI